MLAAFLLLATAADAQTEAGISSCGTDDAAASPPPGGFPAAGTPCFDASYVVQNGVEIWIKLHVHVFLKSDGSGKFFEWRTKTITNSQGQSTNVPWPIERRDIYAEVDKLIDDANLVLGDLDIAWVDQAQFGIPQATVAPFMPVRLLLDGVTIHNNTAAQGLGSYPSYLGANFGRPGVFNLFLTEWVGGSQGEAEGYGRNARNFTAELLSPTLVIHELAHCLDLRHAFDDMIADTPTKRFAFDWNHDGDTNDYFPNQACKAAGSENPTWTKGIGCWMVIDNPDQQVDYNGDCVNDYTYGQVNYPCLSWTWASNNIMDYTGYNTIANAPALTAGQIAVTLEDLRSYKCGTIASIGTDCRPPNALVYAIPDSRACGITVYTGLSQNNDRYRVTVSTPTGAQVATTGWVNGEVPRTVWFPQRTDRSSRAIPGQPFYDRTNYTVKIEADGPCGGPVVSYQAPVTTYFGCEPESVPAPARQYVAAPGGGDPELYVREGQADERIVVQVYDEQSGRMVDQQSGTLDKDGATQQAIDVSEVPSGGTYTVKVLHEQGGVGTTRSANPK